VFYCKVKSPEDPTLHEKESVLKIYNQDDIKSFTKEINVFNTIADAKKKAADSEKFVGFPALISSIQGPDSAEILMEALGPNIRKLLKQCPGAVFSKPSVY